MCIYSTGFNQQILQYVSGESLMVIWRTFVHVDTDECVQGTDNCDSELASCTNTEGSFNCSCIGGYEGDGTEGNCSGEFYSYEERFNCQSMCMWIVQCNIYLHSACACNCTLGHLWWNYPLYTILPPQILTSVQMAVTCAMAMPLVATQTAVTPACVTLDTVEMASTAQVGTKAFIDSLNLEPS